MKRSKERPDGIIAWHPDRLARNMPDAAEIIDLLDEGPLADMQFAMYSFHNDSSGKEHLAMEFARAKAYSDHLQDNVLRGLIQQELHGRGTRPLPPAFAVVDDEDDPDYLKIIPSPLHEHWRRAFEWKRSGMANEEIARKLVEEKKYVHRNWYKKQWKTVNVDKDYIGKHLKNPLHCGWLVTGENSKEPRRVDLNAIYPEQFHHPFPVVLTLEEFKQINPDLFSDTARNALRPRRRSEYPLSGKVFCKELHARGELATMTGSTNTGGSGKPSPRFACQRCRPTHSINMDKLYKAVEVKLRCVKLTEREHTKFVITAWHKYEGEREAEDAERRQLNALEGQNTLDITEAREVLNTMRYGKPKAADTDIAVQVIRLERLETEQQSIGKRKEKLNEDSTQRYWELDAFLELAKNASVWWKKASPEKKRKLADLIVSNVVVDADGTATVSLTPDFEEWSKRGKTDDGRDDPSSRLPTAFCELRGTSRRFAGVVRR